MGVSTGKLTSSRILSRNVFLNLIGTAAPLIVAIVTIPILIRGLGTERFGVLSLAWMVVGYFNLFDLGLGRALTKLVSEKLGKGENDDVPGIIWTALLLMLILGLLGAVVVAILSPWLVGSVFNISEKLQPETLTSFYLLAISIPVVISVSGLRGVVEAHQRFGLVNIVRIPVGIFTFVGPVLVLNFSNNLVPIVATLIVGRVVSWCVYFVFCLKLEPSLCHTFGVYRTMVKPLFCFGSWMTVTNIVSPLMSYLDRFIIGATLTMTAVAYYTTPYDVITKLTIVPAAVMGVMFPAFSAAIANEHEHAANLFKRTVSYIFIILYPVTLIFIMFAHEGLDLWLGSTFADNSSLVLQLLAIAVFVNCHAQIPFGFIQAAGRPDLTAKLHLIELPFYLLILWWLVACYGIVGAAIAWGIRVVVDTVLLFTVAHKLLPIVSLSICRSAFLLLIVFSLLLVGVIIKSFMLKIIFLILVIPLFFVSVWFVLFSSIDREEIKKWIKLTLLRIL